MKNCVYQAYIKNKILLTALKFFISIYHKGKTFVNAINPQADLESNGNGELGFACCLNWFTLFYMLPVFRLFPIVPPSYFTLNGKQCNIRASPIAKSVKNLPAMQETWVQFLGQEDPLEKGMATHSSTLA